MISHSRNLIQPASIMLVILLFIPIGCATTSSTTTTDAAASSLATVTPPPPITPTAYAPEDDNGSLWNQDSPFAELFVLPKARKIGDIVTIKIVESSSATNQASTVTDRESGLTAQLQKFFGLENQFNDAAHPNFNPARNLNPFSALQGSMASEFDGSGTTRRSGDLTAYISARVTEILPGGNMRIVGSREIEVNNERQYITLSGVIRTRDVSPENVIMSTYVSDALISYSGQGIIDERQRPGWLADGLNKIWPF